MKAFILALCFMTGVIFSSTAQKLPDVPSAEEVERDGADLGEMNKVLLQKVEELTLYIIDLQRQINEMKSNR